MTEHLEPRSQEERRPTLRLLSGDSESSITRDSRDRTHERSLEVIHNPEEVRVRQSVLFYFLHGVLLTKRGRELFIDQGQGHGSAWELVRQFKGSPYFRMIRLVSDEQLHEEMIATSHDIESHWDSEEEILKLIVTLAYIDHDGRGEDSNWEDAVMEAASFAVQQSHPGRTLKNIKEKVGVVLTQFKNEMEHVCVKQSLLTFLKDEYFSRPSDSWDQGLWERFQEKVATMGQLLQPLTKFLYTEKRMTLIVYRFNRAVVRAKKDFSRALLSEYPRLDVNNDQEMCDIYEDFKSGKVTLEEEVNLWNRSPFEHEYNSGSKSRAELIDKMFGGLAGFSTTLAVEKRQVLQEGLQERAANEHEIVRDHQHRLAILMGYIEGRHGSDAVKTALSNFETLKRYFRESDLRGEHSPTNIMYDFAEALGIAGLELDCGEIFEIYMYAFKYLQLRNLVWKHKRVPRDTLIDILNRSFPIAPLRKSKPELPEIT